VLRTVEATIDRNGKVKLAETIKLRTKARALVTILDEQSPEAELSNEAALLAEASLAKDWLSPEEGEAWKHLADLPHLGRR
jgi:hypothetical protein